MPVGFGDQTGLALAFRIKAWGPCIGHPDLNGAQSGLAKGITALLDADGNGGHGGFSFRYM